MQTGKVIKQPTGGKAPNKKAKKGKQNAKSNVAVPTSVQEVSTIVEPVEEKIIVPVKSIPLIKPKNTSDNKAKNKNAKRNDKGGSLVTIPFSLHFFLSYMHFYPNLVSSVFVVYIYCFSTFRF